MNNLFPAFLKLAGGPCLVVGGGAVAERKIRGLLASGAAVTVVAPEITPTIAGWASEGRIRLHKRPYRQGDVAGCLLAIAATNQRAVNRQVYQEAREQNILVNVVDDPPLCSFFYPAIYQDGDLKIAVSTNGKSPALAKRIRDRIKGQIEGQYGQALIKLGQLREALQQAAIHSRTRGDLLEAVVEQWAESSAVRMNDGAVKCAGGKVYLVGAGPGDPDLITVKGLRLLQSADVIVYDALIDKRLLDHARSDAQLIFAGKRCGRHSRSQGKINNLLIEAAARGQVVVRVKGGDPFIFGRGGEELKALAEAGVDFEIVPGITAGVAAPAYAGIPLTARGVSSSVAFVTGHTNRDGAGPAVDWAALARGADTLVIYMGTKNLPHIARELVLAGRPNDTPVAVIENATTTEQRTFTATLAELVEEKNRPTFRTPALIVIGEVVRQRYEWHWHNEAGLPSKICFLSS